MTRARWRVIVTNADGSVRADRTFRTRWATWLAVKLVMTFRLGHILTLRYEAPR